MTIETRPIHIDDWTLIVSLWDKAKICYRSAGRDSEESMMRQYEESGDLILGSFHGERLVGVVIGSDDGRKGWINRLAVDPEFLDQGIGAKLILECENALKKKGREVFSSLVGSFDERSIQVFKKCGYVLHDDVKYMSKRENDDV